MCRKGKEEEEDILYDCNKGEIDDLEEPCRNFCPKNFPAIIFVLATESESAIKIKGNRPKMRCSISAVVKETHKLNSPRRHVLYDNLHIQITCK